MIQRNVTDGKNQIAEILKKNIAKDLGIVLNGMSICHYEMNDVKVCPDQYFALLT